MASEHDRRLAEYARQVDDLQGQLKGLEEEVIVLRKRLQDAPKRVRTLEGRILETKGQLQQAVAQNERLSATLRGAREHIAALREEVEKLTQPPSAYGTLLGRNDDGTVDVYSSGRKMRVELHPELRDAEITRGQLADVCVVTTDSAEGAYVGQALSLVGKRGRVVMTAIPHPTDTTVEMSLFDLTLYEKQLRGCLFGSSNPRTDIFRMLELYRAGRLKLDELITREYTLDQVNEGYEDLHNGRNLRGLIRF